MSQTSVGRAAFNVKHLRRDNCGGDTTRGDRKSLLKESMRELDPDDLAHHAAMNSNIVVADAHLNVPFVNNGDGTFRRAESVDEVLDYQDARMDDVRVQKNSFETSMFVVHLPKSMCEEIPDYYTSTVEGREVKRPRYVACDYEEAKQYFEESMRWLADNYIPGGIDAVAGGDVNFDESTPHTQFQADTFSPDPDEPSKLRCRPGIAYNTDKSVRYKDGPKKGKQIGGKQKMIDAQRGLRDHMHSLGYPVELEVSERHDESLNPDRYAEQQDRERDLMDREAKVPAFTRAAAKKGYKEGKEKGYDAGREEAGTLIANAHDRADNIVANAQAQAQRLRDERDDAKQQRDEMKQERDELKQEHERLDNEAKQKTTFVKEETAKLRKLSGEIKATLDELWELDEDVEALKSSRDEMAQLDSDFLDHAMTLPGVPEKYERFKVGRVMGMASLDKDKREHYERTVGENNERLERFINSSKKQSQRWQQQKQLEEEEKRKKKKY